MKESTKRFIALQNKILDTLESKDLTKITISELNEFAKAVSAASSITTETMSDMLERIGRYEHCNPAPYDATKRDPVGLSGSITT